MSDWYWTAQPGLFPSNGGSGSAIRQWHGPNRPNGADPPGPRQDGNLAAVPLPKDTGHQHKASRTDDYEAVGLFRRGLNTDVHAFVNRLEAEAAMEKNILDGDGYRRFGVRY